MIHVAVAFDDAYAPWAATLIRSVLDTHPLSAVRFHVLGAPVDTDGISRLRDWVREVGGSVETYDVRAEMDHMPAVGRFGPIVWSRSLLPDLLPEEPRALYLDADTFVLSSLEPLWSTAMDEPLGAVANVIEPSLHRYVRSLGIEDVTSYFNSGVLLMDLDRLRSLDLIGELARFASEAERLRWPDQDALNVLFADRWMKLHPRWNAMSSLWNWREWSIDTHGRRQVEEATRSPSILHFEGPSIAKPWHYLCTHPFAERYRSTLARTPWAGVPLVDQTAGTRLVAMLPRAWWMRGFVGLTRWRRRIGRLARR